MIYKDYLNMLQDDRKAEWDDLDSLFQEILFLHNKCVNLGLDNILAHYFLADRINLSN
ncbi:MAG: hypothetical protein K0R92_3012 [Lachnospiraceae bacterium]|jgi:hypothetical protein|nr:hypothetical protein [Lachnospiraceae bacterium]